MYCAIEVISEGYDRNELHVRVHGGGYVVTRIDQDAFLESVYIGKSIDTPYLQEILVKCTFRGCEPNGSLWYEPHYVPLACPWI